MKKRIIFYLCVVQGVTILLLGVKIYQQNQVLGISVNPVIEEGSQKTISPNLANFFEPKVGNQPDGNKNFSVTNTINKDTLNERFEYPIVKDAMSYRIITLGDSFTFGLHVATKDNWTELLEDLLNRNLECSNIAKFEVINLGVSAYDRVYAVERYKRRGLKYTPDLVLWLDVKPYRDTDEIMTRIKKLPKSLSVYERYNIKFREFADEIDKEKTEEEKRNVLISNIKNLTRIYENKLLLLSFPFTSQGEKDSLESISKSDENIYYFGGLVDLYKNHLTFKNDGHPNEEGHKRIAQDIFAYLKDAKLIPCK